MLTSTRSLENLIPKDPTVTDDRPTLAKFRRLGLYVILKHNGHDIEESLPHTEMLAYATAHEKNLTLDGLVVTMAEYGGFTVAKPREIIKEEQAIDQKIQEKRKTATEKFTKDEAFDWDAARAEASTLGIDITRMKEEEVIAAIVDAKKDTSTGYDTMSWPNIKAAAKERGIEIYGKTKPQLIAALKGE